ncbi:DUF916 domain-containing protein [Vagococcus humatus]|uniref:Uncharacterized protein n=1 Tax=Vagococcus humatus TaxID=1889241 RepID=A0A3R9YXQ8_9ENTE|nr:DUF916 domain-containing protein [Vagococcus humatus]RST89879.1 hypothetical protein C7P63_02025 [Vagococcus humatus]
MLKKCFHVSVWICLCLASWLLLGETCQGSSLDFNAEVKLPNNQVDANLTYFDLQMKPNQKQRLQVDLTNLSDKAVKIKAAVATATTNDQGKIVYQTSKNRLLKNIPVKLEEAVVIPTKQVVIPKGETLPFFLEVTMPANSYEGVLVGSVQFTQMDLGKDTTKKSQEMMIKNVFSRTIAILVRENKQQVSETVDLTSFSTKQEKNRTYVVASLEHPVASILSPVTIQTELIDQHNPTEVLAKQVTEDIQLAPFTQTDFPVIKTEEPLKSGVYSLDVKVTDSQNHTWKFKEQVKVQSNKEKTLTQPRPKQVTASKPVSKKTSPLLVKLCGSCLGLIAIIGGYDIYLVKKGGRK